MNPTGTPPYSEEIRRAEQLRQSGQTRMAVNLLRGVLEKDKEHFTANYSLGMLYHHSNRDDLAIHFLKKAVVSRSDVFEAVINLGIIQRDKGFLKEAQVNLEKAVAIKPASAIAHVTLGMLLMDRNQLDAALSEVERGLQLDPDDHETYARLGLLMQIRGEPEKAASYYRKVIEFNPLDGTAHRSLAYVQRQTEYNDDIQQMEVAIRSPNAAQWDRILLGYALSKVFDDLGQFDQAFDYLQNANRLQRQSFSYSIANQKLFFDRHKAGLDRKFIHHYKGHGLDDKTPIFVVGMPRSGTSLVEQILASHPLAFGAGEVEYSRFLVDVVEKTSQQPFPLGITRVSPEALAEAGRAYIEKLRFNAGSAERVIDKMPHNFLRIGLFAAVMPQAKIVLCERNPLDNCLSIYQNFFGKEHGYTSNLSELGQYYRLYQDLMDWWEKLLPGHFYRIKYEQLVSDTEAQVRQLLEYCELPYDENCLSFHNTRRHVKTPSASQVQQPVYQNSIARWKNYKKHLQPLHEALKP